MHENKNIFFSKFWRKPGILIPDLYFYDIKIQTSIKKNLVKNTRGNHKFFRKYIFWKFFWTGPDPTQKNLGRSPLLHEEWAWIIIHARCSCMNRRRELIHARCSCSEQRGRRRRKRRRGKEGWPAMAVVWPAWRAAVVADGGWGGGLSSSPLASLCCFLPLFFVLSVNKVSSSFFVDGGSRWRRRKDRWWFAEGAADSRLLLWFFFSPASTPPLVFFLSVLFCSPVALTSAAPSSVSDNGGAAVIGGAAGRNSGGDCCSSLRWRAVFAAVFPPVQRCRLLLLQGCCSSEGRWWEAAGGCWPVELLWGRRWGVEASCCNSSFPLCVSSVNNVLLSLFLLKSLLCFFFKLSFLLSCSSLCHYPSLLLQNFAPLRSSLSQKIILPSFLCSPLYL